MHDKCQLTYKNDRCEPVKLVVRMSFVRLDLSELY